MWHMRRSTVARSLRGSMHCYVKRQNQSLISGPTLSGSSTTKPGVKSGGFMPVWQPKPLPSSRPASPLFQVIGKQGFGKADLATTVAKSSVSRLARSCLAPLLGMTKQCKLSLDCNNGPPPISRPFASTACGLNMLLPPAIPCCPTGCTAP